MTSVTSITSHHIYLQHCHHSHQHLILILLPIHVWYFLGELPGDISMAKFKKITCFINRKSAFGILPAKVPVQLLVLPPPEQHQSSPTKLYMQCILRTLCTNVSTATSSDPSFYSPTMSLTSLVSSLVTSSFTLCISPSTIW